MSRNNVETIRRVYDAFARGDFRSALDIYELVPTREEALEAVGLRE